MKKVDIITFYSSHNYGAMLQAYALQKKCLQLHTDCKIIDYCTPEMIGKHIQIKRYMKTGQDKIYRFFYRWHRCADAVLLVNFCMVEQ